MDGTVGKKKKWKRGEERVEEGGEINKFNPIIGQDQGQPLGQYELPPCFLLFCKCS